MNLNLENFRQTKPAQIIKSVLSNKFFPFFTAAISLLSYFLKIDLLCIYNLTITFVLICVFCDELSPAVSVALFLNTMVSPKEEGSSAYFTQPHILAQVIVLIVLAASALIYRLVRTFALKKFKLTPTFWGLCGLSVAFMMNGIFSDYAASQHMMGKNFLYGLILIFCFLVVFVVVKDDIATDEAAFIRIAYAFVAFSLLLIVELAHKYITAEGIIVDGKIERELLKFGWGTYTTFSALAVMCLPASIYLAGREKYGFIFTIYSMLVLASVVLSCARQAMVVAAIILPVCLIITLIKGNNRILNICLYGAGFLIAILSFLLIFDSPWKYFVELFKALKYPDGGWDGNARVNLWKLAIAYFRSSPITGVGFFSETFLPDYIGFAFYPEMYHNTFMELLGACGIVGLIAYAIHRIQTVQSFFENITVERAFIAFTVLALLIDSLVDNHIFKVMPTIVYSMLIALLIKSEGINKSTKTYPVYDN